VGKRSPHHPSFFFGITFNKSCQEAKVEEASFAIKHYKKLVLHQKTFIKGEKERSGKRRYF